MGDRFRRFFKVALVLIVLVACYGTYERILWHYIYELWQQRQDLCDQNTYTPPLETFVLQKIQTWKTLAAKGDDVTQCSLGLAYHRGYLGPPNDKEAVAWLEKSADRDNATAALWLGIILRGKDDAASADWLLKSANLGDWNAQRLLAQDEIAGKGIKQNILQAVQWYERAASQGDFDAQFFLASAYRGGYYGLPPDYRMAYMWRWIAITYRAEDAVPVFSTPDAKTVKRMREDEARIAEYEEGLSEFEIFLAWWKAYNWLPRPEVVVRETPPG
jgi:hypothetical protein